MPTGSVVEFSVGSGGAANFHLSHFPKGIRIEPESGNKDALIATVLFAMKMEKEINVELMEKDGKPLELGGHNYAGRITVKA